MELHLIYIVSSLAMIEVVLACWFLKRAIDIINWIVSRSPLGCVYALGCELIFHTAMPFDFIILFNLQKKRERKKGKN